METHTHFIHMLKPGEVFAGRYRLIKHVSSDGFTDVWLAEDTEVEIETALKIYTRPDGDGKRELTNEYRLLRDVSHPNLLRSEHFGADGDVFYLEMRYCDGGNMAGRSGKLDADSLRRVARDICNGLAYLHAEGIIHQDVKPENILHDTARNRYLLSGFDISCKICSRPDAAAMTVAYAPPEKFGTTPADCAPDTKGDMFSLGVTLYELATGVLPVDQLQSIGQQMFINGGELSLYFGDIADPQVRQVVQRCLNYRKEDRPTAVEALGLLGGKKTEGDETPKDKSVRTAKPPTVKVKVSNQPLTQNTPKPPTPQTPAEKWLYVTVILVLFLFVLVLL